MFSKIFSSLLLVSALAAGVASKPIPKNRLAFSRRTDPHSFNHWGGFSSLDHFDNFYGVGNFDGSQHFSQKVVNQVVCHTQQVEIIQQRLVVLQEMAKRIITEQVCDVETQVILFEQHHSSLGGFGHDIRRNSGHQVGFDANIVSHFGDIISSDGSLSNHDWGFTGQDVGSNTVIQSGSNWVDATSPVSVNNAYSAAFDAYRSLHPEVSPSSNFDSFGSSESVPVNAVPSDSVPAVNVVPSSGGVVPGNGTDVAN